MVVTTVGDGVEVEAEVVGDGMIVVEERLDVGDVVDGVGVVLEVVLSMTTIEESDVVTGSDDEIGEVASLVGWVGEFDVGGDTVLSVLEGVDDEGASESLGSMVELTAGAPSSGAWNGAPVPSQYKVSASGPPHTCDASPLHAILQSASEICFARLFN